MRKFALYLPQFHEIKENNEWWGKGFTEWTHVTQAKPLYKNHKQPKAPLDDNYYNLMDKETVEWQTNLAAEYGVDGFVYYHYYFEGKLIMEKPAENLLKWTDIPQNFFFCWANHSWFRAENGQKTLLIEQTYGKEESWEQHFLYLLPFFKDERYEKKDNKPVFMIYDSNFDEKTDIFAYFEKRCKENGFDGIYLIDTYKGDGTEEDLQDYANHTCKQTEMLYLREPMIATNLLYGKFHSLKWYLIQIYLIIQRKICPYLKSVFLKYNGTKLYEVMIKNESYNIKGKKIAHGLFFEWDNTPRHGRRGYVISPPSEEVVLKFYDMIKDEDYVFINAWNEWAEGMVLEPTVENGYRYLEIIKKMK